MKCPACQNNSYFLNNKYFKCPNCGLVYKNKPRFFPVSEYPPEMKNRVYKTSKTRIFAYILNFLEKYKKDGNKLLDIGSAYGDFLELAIKKGWLAEGIEIDPKMAAEAEKRGFKVHCQPLEKADLEPDYYDAATMYEVISQMTEPVFAVNKLYETLKTDGILIIREFNSVFHISILGRFGGFFSFFKARPQILHNYNFGPKSLKILLEKTGFKKIKILNSLPSSGDPYDTGGFFGPKIVGFLKTLYYWFSQFIYFVSCGKLLIAPSLIITAEKGISK